MCLAVRSDLEDQITPVYPPPPTRLSLSRWSPLRAVPRSLAPLLRSPAPPRDPPTPPSRGLQRLPAPPDACCPAEARRPPGSLQRYPSPWSPGASPSPTRAALSRGALTPPEEPGPPFSSTKLEEMAKKSSGVAVAMLVHPDKNMGNDKAADAFKKASKHMRRTWYIQQGFSPSEGVDEGPSALSRRIACKKCGDFHLWIYTGRPKLQGRWCQDCKGFIRLKMVMDGLSSHFNRSYLGCCTSPICLMHLFVLKAASLMSPVVQLSGENLYVL
ncbi:hypothetical protein ZWY2020_018976 [Hordeum vulgare]|nr:hypothetical protein ZWY2020_018976 [Hordeum vulgare]